MEELCVGCNLSHMISYDDTDGDGRLNVNEFYMAFSKLYSKYRICDSLVVHHEGICRGFCKPTMKKVNV